MQFTKKVISYIFALVFWLILIFGVLIYLNDGKDGFKAFFPFNAMNDMVQQIYHKNNIVFEKEVGVYFSDIHSDLTVPDEYRNFKELINSIYIHKPFNSNWSFMCESSIDNRDCYQITYNPFANSSFTLINSEGKEVTVYIHFSNSEKKWVIREIDVGLDRVMFKNMGDYFYETIDLIELCASNNGTRSEQFYCGAYGKIFQRLRDEPNKIDYFQNLLLESGRMGGHDFSQVQLFVPNEKAISFLKKKNESTE